MDRRGFLRAFGIRGAGVAAGAAVIHNIPEAKANDIGATGRIESPTPAPTDALAEIEKQVGLIATEAAQQIEDALGYDARGATVHKCEALAMTGDTIALPDGRRVKLARHMETTVPVLDLNDFLRNSGAVSVHMRPLCIALANAISLDCEGRGVLCFGSHPLPFRGTGVIAARGDSAQVRVRALLYYAHAHLNHHLTIDTFYGVGYV
jgi:hypothetical protein